MVVDASAALLDNDEAAGFAAAVNNLSITLGAFLTVIMYSLYWCLQEYAIVEDNMSVLPRN